MIIVTGGAGFIGSCLVSALNNKGLNDILIVDSLGSGNKWKNLVSNTFTEYQNKHDFIDNIRNNKIDISNISTIFHLGACSTTTEKDSEYLMQNNTMYTKELAQIAINNNIPFIYASSAATYGIGSNGYDDDETKLDSLEPINMYGYSKHLFDQMASKNGWFNKITGLKFFNVFGPNENHKTNMTSIVYNAYHQIKQTHQMKLFKSNNPDYNDGEQLRDFIYITDVVNVMLWFYDNPNNTGLFNLGRGETTSWKSITEAVFKSMNLKPNINFVEMPEILKGKYQYYTKANMDKLKVICPVKFTSIEDSVNDYVNNYLTLNKFM